MMRAALLQICASEDPVENLPRTLELVERAADAGARFVATPEVTNCVSSSRAHQDAVLRTEDQDATLAALRELAARRDLWIAVGSLALKTVDTAERFANRSLLIDPQGNIRARYDKIHMFDVQVSETETYRESDAFKPGDTAVVVDTPFGCIGLSICYDVRFPSLYRALAKAGAEILLIPAAFTTTTGAAHWEPLLRARAIENGAFVLAAAQTGTHRTTRGKRRSTHGHSMAISPWGDVLADAGKTTGITLVDLDMEAVRDTRKRIPSLTHDRDFKDP